MVEREKKNNNHARNCSRSECVVLNASERKMNERGEGGEWENETKRLEIASRDEMRARIQSSESVNWFCILPIILLFWKSGEIIWIVECRGVRISLRTTWTRTPSRVAIGTAEFAAATSLSTSIRGLRVISGIRCSSLLFLIWWGC